MTPRRAKAAISGRAAANAASGPGLVKCRFRAGADGGELARAHAFGVARDRRRDHRGAQLREPGADRLALIDADAGAVDHNARHRTVAPGGGAVCAEQHLLEVVAGSDHREQDVDRGEIGRRTADCGARGGQRLGLGARPVPDLDRMAGPEQQLGHGMAHAAEADPADRLIAFRHRPLPCIARVRFR